MNRDEAERCIQLSKAHFSRGNHAQAIKLAKKSVQLHAYEENRRWLKIVSATTSTTTTTATSSSTTTTSTEFVEQQREYTADQVEAVQAILKHKNDYYAVLSLAKDASESDIKKAYRKLALQFHPDKNAAPGASEAFKLIGTAFGTLSDTDKRRMYDQFGPDATSSFRTSRGGFGHSSTGARGAAAAGREMSPEDIFNLFFGGASPFHASGFTLGPDGNLRFGQQQQQQFRQRRNMHEFDMDDLFGFSGVFGGGPPRRGGARRHHSSDEDDHHHQRPARAGTGAAAWMIRLLQFLPLFIVLFSSSITSFLSYLLTPAPTFTFTPTSSTTLSRQTSTHHVTYYVNPSAFRRHYSGNAYKIQQLDDHIEVVWERHLVSSCQREVEEKQRRVSEAKWWGDDQGLARIQAESLKACEQLEAYKNRT